MDQKDNRNELEIKEAAGVKPDEMLTDEELGMISGGGNVDLLAERKKDDR